MARKTFDIETLMSDANRMLETPDSTLGLAEFTPEQAFRLGMAALLEVTLRRTGNYHGFVETDPDKDRTRRAYR